MSQPTVSSESVAGPWALHEPLGEGGSGTVFRAVRRGDGREAAVKVLRAGLWDQGNAAARLEREARLVSTLHHPNILEVFETGRLSDGRPWLAMPRLHGQSLRQWMEQHPGPQDVTLAWRLLRPVALALDAAHAAGVVHRDVKPENIFLEGDASAPTPRLIDFGLARGTADDVKVTVTGTILGTPLYMPPEQWWTLPITTAADQYSLACVFFELLAGRPAHAGSTMPELMQSHISGNAPSLANTGAQAPPDLDGVLRRAMARAPEARFPSVSALVEAVDAACGLETSRGAMRMLAPAWMLLTVAMAGLLGYAGMSNPLELSRLAGWGIYPVTLSLAVGTLLLLVGKRGGTLAVLAASAVGTLGTATGWVTVLAHTATIPPAELFEMMQMGMLEANVNRWASTWLAGGLATALFMREWDGRLPPRGTPLWLGGVATGMLAAAAILLGLPDGAWVCLTASVVLMLGPHARNRAQALGPALWRPLCVMLAGAAVLARSQGGEAALWASRLERAQRALQVTHADAQQAALWVVLLLAAATVVVCGVANTMQLTPAPALASHRGGRLVAVLWAAWVVADIATVAWVWRHQQAAWARLEPMFSTWSMLDPPSREGLPQPAVAPALRLARNVVDLDAVHVGLTAALSQPEGTLALARDLSHRMAQQPEVMQAPVQLLLMVDREVPLGLVSRALGVAYGLGVRRVQWLFTRGPAPVLAATAPARAAYALPSDFGGVDVVLSDVEGRDLAPASTCASLGETLQPGTTVRVVR